MFDIGQKVICINATCFKDDLKWHGPPLILNKIYTVRDYVPDHFDEGDICIRLVELVRDKGYDEYGFRIQRFKSLEMKKTDISIFENILNKFNNKETISI